MTVQEHRERVQRQLGEITEGIENLKESNKRIEKSLSGRLDKHDNRIHALENRTAKHSGIMGLIVLAFGAFIAWIKN